MVESRILFIFESEEKFKSLPKSKQKKVFFQLVEEINTLNEHQLLNEQFGDFLQKIFGNTFGGVAQGFIEPMVGSVLGTFGLGGYFKDFVTSFIVTNPGRIARAFKSCEDLTKLIAESLSEAMFMTIQRSQGMEGRGYDILRNILGGAIKDTGFIKSIEEGISDGVCSIFDKFSGNAGNVLNKLKEKGQSVVSDVTAKGKEALGGLQPT